MDFITDDFLLQSERAKELYHNFAKDMPIYDYHCHLSAQDIAEDKQFDNITQVWLYGDHYKWRAMRSNGIEEKYCTGDATDKEKFMAWSGTVPKTLRNPLYHWTHLELKRYFNVDELLSPQTAEEIYDKCNKQIIDKKLSPQKMIERMNVRVICTTDDPIDDLKYHKQLKNNFATKVLPTFRPDKAMNPENEGFLEYIEALADASDINIDTYSSLVEALKNRHNFFHETGCRLSDHALITAYADKFTTDEIELIFQKLLSSQEISDCENRKFKSALMLEFGKMNAKKGWVMQLHIGALRNNNSRLFNQLGPDTGFDSIDDREVAAPLSKFLDTLDTNNQLPKTILYNLNPKDNEVLATMIGNFQDGSVAGKMQFGSGWWFLDQKDGMIKQINALSTLGLLSQFVGMLTDSRSFLSYPRHEYFRRILCNLLGDDIENGEIPNDMELVGNMVKDISYNNAEKYFKLND